MSKQWMSVLAALVLLPGCATVNRGSIPVVDAGAPVSEASGRLATQTGRPTVVAPAAGMAGAAVRAEPETEEVTVMVPKASSAPLQTFSAPVAPAPLSVPLETAPAAPAAEQRWSTAPSTGSSVSSGAVAGPGALSSDEQLDGPVLALLTTAQKQQGGGDLNSAAASLERAQRIAPREPQVLYRLAQVRLEQGDAVQAEQLSRRALGYAAGRPSLQASLWELIAQARERQGDAAGAAQARERARVAL